MWKGVMNREGRTDLTVRFANNSSPDSKTEQRSKGHFLILNVTWLVQMTVIPPNVVNLVNS